MPGVPALVPPAEPPHIGGRRPGPFIRKLLRAKRKAGSETRTAYRLLKTRPGIPVPSPRLAVRAVLLRTAIELARAARKGTKDLGYEIYHQSSESYSPVPTLWEGPEPRSFPEALVRARNEGEDVLTDLVSREVAKLLGEAAPDQKLRREVSRRIELFEALVFEGLSLHLW